MSIQGNHLSGHCNGRSLELHPNYCLNYYYYPSYDIMYATALTSGLVTVVMAVICAVTPPGLGNALGLGGAGPLELSALRYWCLTVLKIPPARKQLRILSNHNVDHILICNIHIYILHTWLTCAFQLQMDCKRWNTPPQIPHDCVHC